MGSLLKSTRNTRALPTGTLRYIRSDYPGCLSDEEVSWLRKKALLQSLTCEIRLNMQKSRADWRRKAGLPTIICLLLGAEAYQNLQSLLPMLI